MIAPFPPDRRLAGLSLMQAKLAFAGLADISDRWLLWRRQGGRCFYCDQPMLFDYRRRRGATVPPLAMTIDHVFTRKDGGREGPKVGACFRCNQTRGTMPAHDFVLVVAYRQGLLREHATPPCISKQPTEVVSG